MIGVYSRSNSYSVEWINTLTESSIDFIQVDPFEDDFISKVKLNNIKIFLMHPEMQDPKTLLFVKNLIYTLESYGVECFPSFRDYYTFDEKISQKYVFEILSIAAPATHIFYDRDAAKNYVSGCSFPIVAKLNKGAGAINVKLIKNRSDAVNYIATAFSTGFDATSAVFKDVSTKFKIHNKSRDWKGVIKRAPATIFNMIRQKFYVQKEKGFVLFQEFVDGNSCDIRVTVIGDKAFIFKRMVRENDFRASGSGNIVYEVSEKEIECISVAFDIARKIGSKCIALDFVRDMTRDNFLLIEYSYAFKPEAVYACPGYWDEMGAFHEGNYRPERAMLEAIGIL
jgi:glutathione synthase/RimK-type ligase-like ATP-grasp enzyme